MKTQISKKSIALAYFMICAVLLTGISYATTADKVVKQEEDKYKDSTVLVEAFLVEVELDALYKSGVSPIGQKPNSVSIKSILQCLNKNKAKVITGAKVAAKQREDGKTELTGTEYVKREKSVKGPEGKAIKQAFFDPYSVGISFSARVFVKSESTLEVSFTFEQTGLDLLEGDIPPQKFERTWANTVSLKVGEPTIVGATQDKKTAHFLVICAHIENK